MNILYVGSLTIPIEDILTGKTENEITGWPAYFHPVYKLIQKGHNVDFAFISSLKEYNICVDWFKEEQIAVNIYIDQKKKRRFGVLSKAYYSIFSKINYFVSVNILVKRRHYDFIYCQEVDGGIGNIIANMHGIPCGVRFYGDAFAHRDKIYVKNEFIKQYGKFGLLCYKPMEFILYRIRKAFILTTDDGTHGDLSYNMMRSKKKKYDFYYWRTGVNKNHPIQDLAIEKEVANLDYIVYPARIDYTKRQDKAIKVLKLLHQKGSKLHLFLIGQFCDYNYYEKLQKEIKMEGLEKYVHFTEGVTQNQVKVYANSAKACILTEDYSNRGNVFFEIFSIGVPIIAFDNGSLNEYVINKHSGYLVKNEEEMADCVFRLEKVPEERTKITKNALQIANEKVLSIDDRFDLEVELIKHYAIGNNIDVFPQKI